MTAILNRLKEPSTWAGVAAMAATFGLSIDAELVQYGTMALAGIAGVAAVFLGEKGPAE